MLSVDFSAVIAGDVKLADIQENYTRADLIQAVNDMVDEMLALVRGLPDEFVTFQPIDPNAYDPMAATEAEKDVSWTLGHVIVHTTATGEESCAQGATLARGVEITGRNRYETPWEEMQTTAQLVQRLEESRRMRLAFLNAWPDEPHLDVYFAKREAVWGKLNAVGYVLTGLFHDTDHVGQIKEIVAQAEAAHA